MQTKLSIINQAENHDYNLNFLKGICYLWQAQYRQARQHFFIAMNNTDIMETRYQIYLSYLGLTEVLNQKKSGLQHCYNSSDLSCIADPEVQFNLACAESLLENRRRCIMAIDKIVGLQLSRDNARLIDSFYEIIGRRKKDQKGVLIRNNFTHKYLGKIYRKKSNFTVAKIELFIKESVKLRYNHCFQKIYENIPVQQSVTGTDDLHKGF